MAKLTGAAKKRFLEKMAAGRRAKQRKATAHHKHKRSKHTKRARAHVTQYVTKHHHHHHKPKPMAKTRKSRKSKSHKSHKSHHKGKHHGSSFRSRFIPTMEEAIAAGTAGVYGYLEGAGAKDKDAIINKVPVPLASVGRSGTVALGLWLAGALTRRRFVRYMARGVLDVATYQIMRRPSKFGSGGDKDVDFTLGGRAIASSALNRRTPEMIERHLQQLEQD